MVSFLDRLREIQDKHQTRVCVGLDPDLDKLPPLRGSVREQLIRFASDIVEQTASYACCYKPNLAFWQSCEAEPELMKVISFIQSEVCLPVILDGKWGDIGNTAKKYAEAAFGRFGADAVTLNTYLGTDTLAPWLDWGPTKGLYVLSHTSNKGAAKFQEDCVSTSGKPLFVYLAHEVAALQTEENARIGFVMGATFPGQISFLGLDNPIWQPSEIPLLIPGIGSQGGELLETVRYAKCYPFVVNSSRGIIHASREGDFASVAGERARELRDQINEALEQAA